MTPPDLGNFFRDSRIDFAQFPEFGVSSFYNRPAGLTDPERRVLSSGAVDLVRSPLAADAIEVCFRSVLDQGVTILEEPHAADVGRYPPVIPSAEPKYAATFVGRCWPFKWTCMSPYIRAMQDRFGERFAVFGSGWPEGVSRGSIDDDQFGQVVAESAVSLSLHEPTQVLDRPFAQNERVFKLLSMGACVVSDANPVLATQFEVGEELLLAPTPAEMVACVERIEDDPERGRVIATAGRTRVLAEHTYAHRAGRLLALAAAPLDPGCVVTLSGTAPAQGSQMCDKSSVMTDVAASDDSHTD